MTDCRPAGFHLPAAPGSTPLCLWFGCGDYVIARSQYDAARYWMDHFGEPCRSSDFTALHEDEIVDIYIDTSEGNVSVLPQDQLRELLGFGVAPHLEHLPASYWVYHFGPGYLASTTED
jgi:hypothetical protein